MAYNPTLSKTPAKAALDAIVDSLDTGTGTGTIKIMDGSQPADPDVAITTQTTLAEINLTTPVFAAATTGTGGNAGYIIAVDNFATLSDTSADASGTASWFRAHNKSDVAKIDGSVGTATADLILNSVNISTGQTVKVTSWTVRLPYQ